MTVKNDIRTLLESARSAAYRMAALSEDEKNQALSAFADLIDNNRQALLAANRKDRDEQREQISESLYQRLGLDEAKLDQLTQGIRDVRKLPNPTGKVLARTRLDDGLVLEKITAPLGVIGIIFESRPDVIPQILALILKSGNAVVLKGGREAEHSNRAFMDLVAALNRECHFLPDAWAQLVAGREAVAEMLHYPEYVDLIIPRGSNELVRHIMENTRIPVLGHADGVCHLYVHGAADISQAVPLVIDAKTQYPAACNALETLLVDASVADAFFPSFLAAADQAAIALRGCEKSRRFRPEMTSATEEDWRTEYGDKTLSIKIVHDSAEAVRHINTYGSHHTDGILSRDTAACEAFLAQVDSACVFANASTRFADGFRFGLGAEIGISTARTHARGPVGLEGLVTYKYLLRGSGQVVADYTGSNPKPFLHESC